MRIVRQVSADIIETLLSGRLADPDGGPALRVPTRARGARPS